jgi:short-subunit dehydrogenase
MIHKYGSWALVAGAAEGLGEAYARALAKRGFGVILVDRQRELLEKLAGQLGEASGIPARKIHLDLASDESVGIMMEAIAETSCRLLIYNAAFSRVKRFLENNPAEMEQYVKVNMQTPLCLIHAFCQHHTGQPDQRKGIVLMSSIAGSWGTQLLGPYGATKAFNHLLAEALYHELKQEGFDVLACIAGATSTPGYLASNPRGGKTLLAVLPPEPVVEECLDALGRRPFVVPGSRNKLNYFFLSRVLPRKASLRIMNRTVGRIYRDKLKAGVKR